MKNLSLLFLSLGSIILGGCNQKTDVNAMLQNPETKTELFNAISSSHDNMMAFMASIQNNEHAMQMMQNDQQMMGNMMHGGGMQMIMQDSDMKQKMMEQMMGDKDMMNTMMANMSKNGAMMGNMMQMMTENGLMSKACMESSMKMMDKKGMKTTGMMK
jgi:transcription initiation factor TFIID subunit TAF12